MHVTALNGHAQPINALEIQSNFSIEHFIKREKTFQLCIFKPEMTLIQDFKAMCLHEVPELHQNI